ncbi:hypothetical protein CK203_037421 [Vitis vinifera]|uniref:Uncharacterized protein n=1 Tax=Vitis vinifera TaxID=29760 RepID=A0A438HDR9_VITVI|nr:hypothetical protein CK203_037421 [Vitis vinifera]
MSFGDPRPGCVVGPVRHYIWVAYRLVVFVRPSIGVLELLGLSIGEIKSLPRTTLRHSEFWECVFTFTAFGHDPKTDDYKGINHWLGSDHENGDVVILLFDTSDEVFGVIPLPDSFGNQRGDIAVYNEMIALIFYPNTYTDTDTATEKRFDMWVMSEYGVKESWTRLFTIGAVSGVERPSGFWSNGGVFMGSSSGELLLYNHFTQQFKNLGVFSVARRLALKDICSYHLQGEPSFP